MQIKGIMVHFAFLKEIFFGLSKLFYWTFKILPPIGMLMGWLLSAVVFGLLVFWCIRIVKHGQEDIREVDYREPHNFID